MEPTWEVLCSSSHNQGWNLPSRLEKATGNIISPKTVLTTSLINAFVGPGCGLFGLESLPLFLVYAAHCYLSVQQLHWLLPKLLRQSTFIFSLSSSIYFSGAHRSHLRWFFKCSRDKSFRSDQNKIQIFLASKNYSGDYSDHDNQYNFLKCDWCISSFIFH